MFKTNHILKSENDQENLELYSSNKASYAIICLNQGGRLQKLNINGHELIKDLSPMTYKETYASSILFPFANRIKDGIYNFDGKTYQLDLNHKQENNAIHGLVYNKSFKVLNKNVSDKDASITLEYETVNTSIGFPYTYKIQLNYILTDDSLTLNVKIKNTDSKTFPFTLGWHPYFNSQNLYNSTLKFDSNKKLVLDERMITTNVEDFKNEELFKIKDRKLDDCFILNTSEILFKTPHYVLQINASSKETFMQVYTPPIANTIAIEPTTGVSDSFNNKIGLQVLKPSESYSIKWEIRLIKNT
ncbi:MAG: aldose 1-epimerase [Flavobacteriaceae bacterium]|nr:aldose 1-epimerase [Flavobacteriaceae bacterium]